MNVIKDLIYLFIEINNNIEHIYYWDLCPACVGRQSCWFDFLLHSSRSGCDRW